MDKKINWIGKIAIIITVGVVFFASNVLAREDYQYYYQPTPTPDPPIDSQPPFDYNSYYDQGAYELPPIPTAYVQENPTVAPQSYWDQPTQFDWSSFSQSEQPNAPQTVQSWDQASPVSVPTIAPQFNSYQTGWDNLWQGWLKINPVEVVTPEPTEKIVHGLRSPIIPTETIVDPNAPPNAPPAQGPITVMEDCNVIDWGAQASECFNPLHWGKKTVVKTPNAWDDRPSWLLWGPVGSPTPQPTPKPLGWNDRPDWLLWGPTNAPTPTPQPTPEPWKWPCIPVIGVTCPSPTPIPSPTPVPLTPTSVPFSLPCVEIPYVHSCPTPTPVPPTPTPTPIPPTPMPTPDYCTFSSKTYNWDMCWNNRPPFLLWGPTPTNIPTPTLIPSPTPLPPTATPIPPTPVPTQHICSPLELLSTTDCIRNAWFVPTGTPIPTATPVPTAIPTSTPTPTSLPPTPTPVPPDYCTFSSRTYNWDMCWNNRPPFLLWGPSPTLTPTPVPPTPTIDPNLIPTIMAKVNQCIDPQYYLANKDECNNIMTRLTPSPIPSPTPTPPKSDIKKLEYKGQIYERCTSLSDWWGLRGLLAQNIFDRDKCAQIDKFIDGVANITPPPVTITPTPIPFPTPVSGTFDHPQSVADCLGDGYIAYDEESKCISKFVQEHGGDVSKIDLQSNFSFNVFQGCDYPPKPGHTTSYIDKECVDTYLNANCIKSEYNLESLCVGRSLPPDVRDREYVPGISMTVGALRINCENALKGGPAQDGCDKLPGFSGYILPPGISPVPNPFALVTPTPPVPPFQVIYPAPDGPQSCEFIYRDGSCWKYDPNYPTHLISVPPRATPPEATVALIQKNGNKYIPCDWWQRKDPRNWITCKDTDRVIDDQLKIMATLTPVPGETPYVQIFNPLDGSTSTNPQTPGTPATTTTTGTTINPPPGAVGICECVNGQPNSEAICGDANPCGALSKPAGSCSYGEWASECAGSGANCPANAGVNYTFWCDRNGTWRFQYPNCVTSCQPGYLAQHPVLPSLDCALKPAGTELPGYTSNVPGGTVTGATAGVSFPYVACDGNQNEYIEMRAFCDQFGQPQWGPGKRTGKACGGASKPKPQDYSIIKNWPVAPPVSDLHSKGVVFNPSSSGLSSPSQVQQTLANIPAAVINILPKRADGTTQSIPEWGIIPLNPLFEKLIEVDKKLTVKIPWLPRDAKGDIQDWKDYAIWDLPKAAWNALFPRSAPLPSPTPPPVRIRVPSPTP